MEHEKNRAALLEDPRSSEQEEAFDAFLTGVDADDFDKMIERVQSLDGLPQRAEPKQTKRKKPRAGASSVAQWIPRFKAKSPEKAPPVPDPRRLPRSERELSPEPTFTGAAPLEAAPEPELARAPEPVRAQAGIEEIDAFAHLARLMESGEVPNDALDPTFEFDEMESEGTFRPWVDLAQRSDVEVVRAVSVWHEPTEETLFTEPVAAAQDSVEQAPTLMAWAQMGENSDLPEEDGLGTLRPWMGPSPDAELPQAVGVAAAGWPEAAEIEPSKPFVEDPPPFPEVAADMAGFEGEAVEVDEAFEEEVRRLREIVEVGVSATSAAAAPVGDAYLQDYEDELSPLDLDPFEGLYGDGYDDTAEVSADVSLRAMALADMGPYEAPVPPPTQDVGAQPEDDALHRSVDGMIQTDNWRTFSRKSEAKPSAQIAAVAAPERAKPSENSLAQALAEIRSDLRQGFEMPTGFRLRDRVDIVRRVCEQVASAHLEGVVHGDLRPANVLVGSQGDAHVIGWGGEMPIGERLDLSTGEAGFYAIDGDPGRMELIIDGVTVVGSPLYLAPELLAGEPATAVSDVYALGLMVIEAVTLTPALGTGNLDEVLERARAGRLCEACKLSTGEAMPKDLKRIVMNAVLAAPGGRAPSAGDLLEGLTAWLNKGKGASRSRSYAWAASGATITAVAAAALLGTVGVDQLDEMRSQVDAVVAEAAQIKVLDGMVAGVERHAFDVDRTLDHYQDLASSLASAAVDIRRHATASPEPLYRLFEFRTPGKQPADLAESSVYGGPVSLDYPMFKLSPKGDFAALSREARKVQWMNDRLKGAFFSAAAKGGSWDAIDATALREQGYVVHRTFLSFDSGLDVFYPGQAGYEDDYEGRSQAYYPQAQAAKGPIWGEAMVEAHKVGEVVPVVAPMIDSDGSFYGVAGLELSRERLVSLTASAPAMAGSEGGWIISDDMKVIVGPAGTKAGAQLPVAGVKAALADNERGVIEAEAGRYAVWAPLPSTGWTYVCLIDPSRVPVGQSGQLALAR